uniref:Protein kinase domain-containing protein n=1 Tax=Oryza meridionalis TaxID=40149 RepID=A0A0E0C1H5_9ORYZ
MLVVVLLILASPASIAGGVQAAASAPMLPLYSDCGKTASRYGPNSTYRSNLQALGVALVAEANATGFATKRVGIAPDEVYGLVLCRGDHIGPDCTRELAAAFQEVTSALCPSSKDATVYYDKYMLRFSSDDFLATLSNEPEWVAENTNSVKGGEAAGLLAERVMVLMVKMASYAANSSSRYATGEVSVGTQGVEKVYGLVQCTPDLTGEQCLSCVGNIGTKMPTWSVIITGQVGAMVVGLRCKAHYEADLFFVATDTTIKIDFGQSSQVQRELKLWEKKIIRESDPGFSLYKFAEINDATNNFSEKLGEGGFGPVFQARTDAKLSWYVRRHIIEGIAQGLFYIHEQSHLCVIHRDLKPSNILLDNELNPKISDFGIARICTSNMTESNTTTVIGTIGYMPPEYFSQKIYSGKSDIFSFGVLVLEIISGKVAFGSYQIEGRSHDLRRYAWQLWKDEKCEELIDPSLSEENEKMDIIRCTQVALLCVQESAEDRPTMREVNMMLNNNNMMLSLPTQPGYHDTTVPSSRRASQPTDTNITLPR